MVSLAERYQSTLAVAHATIEQQQAQLAQHAADEAAWVEERASLHRQLREVAGAFSELRTASVADHQKLRAEVDAAKKEALRERERATLAEAAASSRAGAVASAAEERQRHASQVRALEDEVLAARREAAEASAASAPLRADLKAARSAQREAEATA